MDTQHLLTIESHLCLMRLYGHITMSSGMGLGFITVVVNIACYRLIHLGLAVMMGVISGVAMRTLGTGMLTMLSAEHGEMTLGVDQEVRLLPLSGLAKRTIVSVFTK